MHRWAQQSGEGMGELDRVQLRQVNSTGKKSGAHNTSDRAGLQLRIQYAVGLASGFEDVQGSLGRHFDYCVENCVRERDPACAAVWDTRCEQGRHNRECSGACGEALADAVGGFVDSMRLDVWRAVLVGQ